MEFAQKDSISIYINYSTSVIHTFGLIIPGCKLLVCNCVIGDVKFFSDTNSSLCRFLETFNSKNSNCHQHHADVDNISTIATAIASGQTPESGENVLTLRVLTRISTTPIFVNGYKDHESYKEKANQRSNIFGVRKE